MKRVFILLAFSLSLAGLSVMAQVPAPTGPVPTAPSNDATGTRAAPTPTNDPPVATAASIAAQQAADERYKRMAADIEELQMDNESLKTKIASLEQKMDDLRQQQAAAANNNNNGVQEDLKRLAESIAAVDKKREEDKQAISEEIRKAIANLEKALAAAPAPNREPPPKPQPDTETPVSENGIPYKIKEGDTGTAVFKAYNADFKSKGWKEVTWKQMEEANPEVDWKHLHVGQTITIPKPEGQ